MSLITGLFKDQDSAENVYKSLSDSGYKANEIDVVMSEETREKYYGKGATLETEVGNKAAEGAGGVTAGLVGELIGWGGIHEDRLKEYEQGINEGGILIGVKSKSDDDTRRFERTGMPTMQLCLSKVY